MPATPPTRTAFGFRVRLPLQSTAAAYKNGLLRPSFPFLPTSDPRTEHRKPSPQERNSTKEIQNLAGQQPSPAPAMVVYTQEHVYRHPWDRVTAAAWRKFTDPASRTSLTHVADLHTLQRRVDTEAGRLHAARSITVRSPPLPFILRRLLPAAAASPSGAAICHCVETSVVDAPARAMDVVVRNVSLRGIIEVEERSSFRPHPDRPDDWTQFRQETTIRCRPLAKLAAVAEKVETRCAERFLQNSAKGREVVERICRYLEAEAAGAAPSAV
uniref:Uncharacterized protein n=1 Tax=Avena sativa TaxID=4498 RepID=A0ACD5ZDV4_AVESA